MTSAVPVDDDDVEVAVLDLQGRIVAVNATWQRFCSNNEGDVLACGPGASYLDVCDAGGDRTSQQVGDAIRQTIRGDHFTGATFTIACDGSDGARWFDLSVAPRFGDDAKLSGATILLWRVEQPPDRLTTAPRLAVVPHDGVVWDLIEAFPDGTVLVDGAGLITHANRELEHLSGYDRSSLLGQPIEMLLPERLRTRHSIWAQGYRAAPRLRAMGAGAELALRRSDGSEMPVEISLAPVTLGQAEMSMASIRDVTVRKSEEEVRRRHADRSSLVAKISSMVLEDIALSRVDDEIFMGTRALLALSGSRDSTREPPPILPPSLVARTHEEVRTARVLDRAVLASTTEPLGADDDDMIRELGREIALVLDLGSARHDRERLEMLEDRLRIGRDLHDTVIQGLIGIGMQLGMPARAGSDGTLTTADARDELLIEELDNAIMRLRLVVFDTRESGPDISFLEIVESILTGASRTLGHVPTLVVRGDLASLTQEVVNHLVPVLREALSNVARHAQAAHTTVTLDVGPDLVELDVLDDGRGLGDGGTGGGTTNFVERAAMVGGSSHLGAGAAGGTRLHWTAALTRGHT
ncbi:hypothetical protein BH09ACT12_BH09ACT12_00610 [soil metagenome]